jgi:hypothetical protein
MCALMIGRKKTQMSIELNFIDGNGLKFHISMTTFVYN